MSDSDRSQRSQNIVASAFCAVALFGSVFLAFAIGGALGVGSGRDQVTAREHYEYVKQNNLRACAGRQGSAATECAAKAVEAAQEQTDSRQDLYAQQDMARWAFWLLVLTAITVAITALGVWFVKCTLDATLKAVEDTSEATEAMRESNRIALEAQIINRKSAEAQIRAYVYVTDIEIEPFVKGDEEFDHVKLIISNGGQSPALIDAFDIKVGLLRKNKDKWIKIVLVDKKMPLNISLPNGAKPIVLPTCEFKEHIYYHTSGSTEWHIQVEGNIRYVDVFGKKRKTTFAYLTGPDFWDVYPDESYRCHPYSDSNQVH